MGAEARIITGVAAGYLLGRGKKMRLALSLAGMLAGKQLSTDPKVLGRQLSELVDADPRLAELKGEVTGELLQAAQGAATAILTHRIDTLSDALHARSDSLRGIAAEMDELAEELPEDETVTGELVEDEDEPPAEKAPAQEVPATKAPAKKSAAKKSATKTAPAKKSAAKKAPDKKSAAKKSSVTSSSRSAASGRRRSATTKS